jgi:phospholipid N-methyltransferase
MFLNELLARPAAVGAICPSSRFLARAMARPLSNLSLNGPHDYIIELGAGTGNVTQALLDQGVPPERLVVIELSKPFTARLRQRFPGLTIIQGSATDLASLLPPNARVRAIVSSLPLCSLPHPVMRTILQQWQSLLGPSNGLAVQFTYNLGQPVWAKHIGGTRTAQSVVWLNCPPARVSTYQFHPTAILPHEFIPSQPDTTHPS